MSNPGDLELKWEETNPVRISPDIKSLTEFDLVSFETSPSLGDTDTISLNRSSGENNTNE